MADLAPKLRLLLRAEVLRGRVAARSFVIQATIYAVAALFAVLGVIMIVAAVYLALAESLGPVYAAAATGLGLLGLAVVCLLVARPLSRGRKAALAQDLERTIRAEVVHDLRSAEAEIRGLQKSLAGVTGLARGPLSFVAIVFGLAVSVSPRLRALLSSLLR